ncbi:MAG: CDP-alcohol phosphatidyltransferase [Nitrospirales bacterium]|nr:CDP-alcohol phosphatidyltransferase [Nitrospirales bacterium]
MTVSLLILGDTPVHLWGLSAHERLRRVLKPVGVTHVVANLAAVPEGHTVLMVRADYVYDNRILHNLVKASPVIVRLPTSQAPVAAHVHREWAESVRAVVCGEQAMVDEPAIKMETPESLASAYQEQLRKFDPPVVLPIDPANQQFLEDQLFAGSYKGITDLVTKWVWPAPAQWVTQWCTRYGIQPNHVTSLGFVLVLIAGVCFYTGQFGWGLLAGWLMTFLDTVDGKLARVTVTSSKVGHVFDHGIDIIHPPLWYLVWGLGLSTFHTGVPGLSVDIVIWIIFGGYILGRLVEGAFQLWLGMFGIFCWRRFDSFSRLITARRNPNLIFLTMSVLVGRPDLGLVAVAGWTLLSTMLLFVRLVMASYVRMRSGPLQSWLREVDRAANDTSLAVRWFTRHTETVRPSP